ncbi:MAG TPA: SGNH/GDSL hydrolase family protein [Vicinamibacterales bacterium]|nr:SGNH/GDSL hydrolase family protein [Vicinamibacterales bacterium]
MTFLRIAVVAAALSLFTTGPTALAQNARGEHWVGTWATAVVPRPQAAPGAAPGRGPAPLNFNNQTLRQLVHVSLGGSRIRIVLSNAFGTSPLAVGAASVALRQKDSAIVAGSNRPLTFSGGPATTIAAGAIAVSDPVSLTVPALADVVIDVFLPGDTTASTSPLTTHSGAMQTNYVSATGNHVGATDFPVSATTQSWFFLSAVDVSAPAQVGAVVAFGDSLTDGTLSTPDSNNRWPDHLARRLMEPGRGNRAQPMGVLNEGIAGNRVLSEVVGPSALARFDRDVLAQSGVTHVIMLVGINDLGLGGNGQALPSATDILAGHRQIVARAHTHGIKVIAGTLLPFEGTNLGAIAPGYYSTDKDARRREINEVIRKGAPYDGVIDFEAVVRDPGHPLQLLATFKGADSLHLTDAGYEAMARAVNLALLRR